MLNVRLDQLESQVLDFYNQNLREICEDRKKLVVDSSNLSNDIFEPNGLVVPNLNLTEKILLGVFHWYMPRELGCLINLWLEENWGGEFKEIKAVLLNSLDTALGYLLVSDRWNDRDFYGNILKKNNVRKFSRIRVRYRKTSRPKRKVWRRGYNDKGSLRLPHNSVGYDYRKLKSVDDQLKEEELLQEKVEELFWKIDLRREEEFILDAFLS